MVLTWLLIIPMVGGLLAWGASRRSATLCRWISLLAIAAVFVLALWLWIASPAPVEPASRGAWLYEVKLSWIPQLGISFHLAMDGLSLLMVMLTALLGVAAVATSWKEVDRAVGFFHFNLLAVLTGILGVFLALDLFLFYFFWELMLVPMYFLIAIWGHEDRTYASIKFFIFTQASGLVMLIAILGLYFVHHAATGVYTFDYADLLGTSMSPATATWLMLGFFVAFAVKLPAVPFHTWLADAHSQAPTAGSVILAGLLLKTGAYGLLRFVWPLFPDAAAAFAPVAMVLGVVGILYGAALAFAQTDLKRLVACTSISHLGFVMLGIFAWNELALQGAVVQMICHGVSTGALFILVGQLSERIGTRDMDRMGGLWATAPRMAGVGMFFALASMGLPGLGNFVGEFLVLLGTWKVSIALAAVGAGGMIASVVYALWMMQRVFQGPNERNWQVADLTGREMAIQAALIAVIVWLGVYSRPVLDTFQPAMDNLRRLVVVSPPPSGEGRVREPLAKELPHPNPLPEGEGESSASPGGRGGNAEGGAP